MIKYLFICLSVLALFSNTSYAENVNDPYKILYYLDGYKCMLATMNINDIPNSPLAPVYNGPNKNNQAIGEAVLRTLVNTRIPVINNRQAILRPDGSTGWVDTKNLYPYSKPCYGMLFANGRHGFGSEPPKRKYNN